MHGSSEGVKIDLKRLTLQLSKLSLYAKMDEKQLKTLLTDVKNGLLSQLKESEKSIKDSVKHDLKETEKSIRSDIEAIKSEVAENKTEIDKLKARVDII